MKHCKYCGNELHEDASFCPYCMRKNITVQTEMPKTEKHWNTKMVMIGCMILLICIAGIIVISSKEKPETISSTDSEINTTQSVEEAIMDVLYHTRVHEDYITTIGEAIDTVFFDYTLDYNLKSGTETMYNVEIFGSYNPNPEMPALAFDGSISYAVDIEANTCVLTYDSNNITGTFLVYIVNG